MNGEIRHKWITLVMLYIRWEGHKSSKIRAGKFHSKFRTSVVALKSSSPTYINAGKLQIGASWQRQGAAWHPQGAAWHPQGVPLLYDALVALPCRYPRSKHKRIHPHLWERRQI